MSEIVDFDHPSLPTHVWPEIRTQSEGSSSLPLATTLEPITGLLMPRVDNTEATTPSPKQNLPSVSQGRKIVSDLRAALVKVVTLASRPGATSEAVSALVLHELSNLDPYTKRLWLEALSAVRRSPDETLRGEEHALAVQGPVPSVMNSHLSKAPSELFVSSSVPTDSADAQPRVGKGDSVSDAVLERASSVDQVKSDMTLPTTTPGAGAEPIENPISEDSDPAGVQAGFANEIPEPNKVSGNDEKGGTREDSENDTPQTPDPDAPLFDRFRELFPPVATQLTARHLNSLTNLWEAVPSEYRGTLAGFRDKVSELVETKQAFDMAKGRLKPVSNLLSMVLTPGKPVRELWQISAEAFSKFGTRKRSANPFADLMSRFAHRLAPASRRALIANTTVKPASANEIFTLLEVKLRTMPVEDRAGVIASYMKFARGEKEPIKDKNLVVVAGEILDLFAIPSAAFVEVFPEMTEELLFTDMVRKHFPNLAQLMLRKGLFTACAVSAASTKIVEPAIRSLLQQYLTSESPDLLGGGPDRVVVLALLSNAFRVPPQELLSEKKLVYAPAPISGQDSKSRSVFTGSRAPR